MSELFLPNAGQKEFESIDTLRDFLKTEKRGTYLCTDFNKIKFSLSKDNEFLIDFGIGNYRFTVDGFNKFCKYFNVPTKFVSGLPYDNIVKDLYASLLNSDKEFVTFLYKDDKIYGISNREEPISTLEVLDTAFRTNHKEFKTIGFNNEEVIVNFCSNILNPIPGDIYGSGLSLHHNGTEARTPTLDFYYWRQVCTNGAVATSLIKLNKFSNRMDKSKFLSNFNSRVDQSLQKANDMLLVSLKSMHTKQIPNEEKPHVKEFLARKLDFNNNEGGSNSFDLEVTNKTEVTYYDLMNFITDYAKDFALVERHELEILGASISAYFRPVQPASELFKGYAEFKRRRIHKESIPTLV